MVKKTHLKGGLIVSLLSNPIILETIPNKNLLYKILMASVYVSGSCVGSLLPDIDMKNSYISRTIPIIYKIYGKRFKHRGFTHSILAVFIFYLWVRLVSSLTAGDPGISLFITGALIGCISHIVLDLFTVEGVNLFSPMKKNISLASIKTNSRKEKKINKYFDFIIYMIVGVNIYIVICHVGAGFSIALKQVSSVLIN